MFKSEFHLWDFPADKIFVQLRESLAKELFDEAFYKAGGISKLAKILRENSKKYGIKRKIYLSDLYPYKYREEPYPLWILNEIVNLTSYHPNEVEENVEWYRGHYGTKIYPRIKEKKMLPIQHDSLFEYVFGILSSSYVSPRNKYYVKEDVGRLAYEISKNVFGYFEVYRQITPTIVHIVFPPIINHILRCHPRTELDEPEENIVGYVLGVFTNKGWVAPYWTGIAKKDKKFLLHISDLLRVIGCDSTLYKGKTEYKLRLNRENSLKFVELVENLSDLDFSPYHKDLLERRIKRKRALGLTSKERKEQILKVLKEPKTIMEVSDELGLSYSPTYNYVKDLEKKNLITLLGERKMKRRCSKVYKVK